MTPSAKNKGSTVLSTNANKATMMPTPNPA
jgi:hypothetical protein